MQVAMRRRRGGRGRLRRPVVLAPAASAPQIRAPRHRRSTGSRAATRPTSRARRRPCRSTTTSRRARPSSSSWPSRPPPTGAQDRLAVHQLRRPRRHRPPTLRGARAPTRSRRSTSASTSSGWIRAASARASPRSTARPTRRPTASTRSRSRRPTTSTSRALSPRTSATSRAASSSTPDPAARVDGQRRARHRPAAPVPGRAEDHVLRLLVRHVPGRRPTRACSRRNYRAMVLDGPVDANAYINDPLRDLERPERAASSAALGRFFQACAADATACSGFPKTAATRGTRYDR